MMSLPVAAGDPAAIHTELNVQVLNADVVNELVESTLQKSRINCADWDQSLTRQAGRESDAVLLGDADVKRAIRKLLECGADAGAIRHGSRQRHDLWVLFHQLRKRITEDRGVSRSFGRAFVRFASGEIEWTGRMPAIVIRLSLWEAFAFRRQCVNYDWSIFDLFGFLECGDKRSRVVSVNIADVCEAETVDQRAGQHCRRDDVFHRLRRVMQTLAD